MKDIDQINLIFKPIESTTLDFNPLLLDPTPEDLLNYHTEHNIPMYNNKYYAGYVSGNTSKNKPIKKSAQKVKGNPPQFSTQGPSKKLWESKKEWPNTDYTIQEQIDKADMMYAGKQNFLKELEQLNLSNEDKEFLTKLAEKESSFRPNIKNTLGYYGYYQFGNSALKTINKTKEDFKDPITQHKSALKLADLHLIPFKNYIGKEVNGITLTKNALRAAAHLAGPGGLKDWLEGTKKTSFAKRGFIDANGTHITKYLKEFSA